MDQQTPGKSAEGTECDNSVPEQPTLYLKDLCRICAEKRDVMVSVFGEEGKTLQLQNKINECLPIKIEELDLLPSSLCHYCVSSLDISHKLYITCRQTDLTFRRMMVHQNNTTQEVDQEHFPKTVKIELADDVSVADSPPSDNFDNSRSSSPFLTSGEHLNATNPSKENNETIPKLETPVSDEWGNSNDNTPSSRQTRNTSVKSTKKSCPVQRKNQVTSKTKKTKKKPSSKASKSAAKSKTPKKTTKKRKRKISVSSDDSYEIKIRPRKKNKKKSVVKRCEECIENFGSFRSYSVHMLECHQLYVCEVHSDFKGTSSAEFQEHKKQCATFLCSICGKNYTTKGHLDYHLRTHGEKEFSCKICGKFFFHDNELKRHTIIHEDTFNFCCHECPRRFRRRGGLANHLKTAHCKDWTYHCNMCDKVCFVEHEIEEHCSQHSELEKIYIGNCNFFLKKSEFYCQICDKYYAAMLNLQSHNKKYHVFKLARQFKCDFCQKIFYKKYALQEHLSVHLKCKSHPCLLCPKSFHSQNKLKEHMLLHENSSLLKCMQCDKSFETRGGLSNHIKAIHLNIKPHCCLECGKRFYRSSDLEGHVNRHSDVRPFPCMLCAKAFKSKNNLNSHMRTHSNIRPYQCQFCEKSYKCNNDLKKHEEKFHPPLLHGEAF